MAIIIALFDVKFNIIKAGKFRCIPFSPNPHTFEICTYDYLTLSPFFGQNASMKTIFVKPASMDRKWFVIDAEGKVLGRVAAKVASIVRGKTKAIYAPH